jgi:hypothetical protein
VRRWAIGTLSADVAAGGAFEGAGGGTEFGAGGCRRGLRDREPVWFAGSTLAPTFLIQRSFVIAGHKSSLCVTF